MLKRRKDIISELKVSAFVDEVPVASEVFRVHDWSRSQRVKGKFFGLASTQFKGG
jgi:hypothetical protein